MKKNPIKATIDLKADGKRHGFLKLPFSRDDSAWGSIMIPITVVANGEGPTALLTGGNHGDEYEGPIALFDLARSLEPKDVTGRVLIVPAFNYPAFTVGRRTSPIDQGNMNRSFPGRPDGTPTEKIADYFNRVLLPEATHVLDFHSGGKTLDFLPYASYHLLDDKNQEAACRAAAEAFNAPYTMAMLEIDADSMYDTAVETQGKIFVTTELRGGGTATAQSATIAKKGLRNFLRHIGILEGEPDIESNDFLDMQSDDCFVFSENDGLFEPVVDLGEQVSKGDLIARVWPTNATGLEPIDYHSAIDGVLATRHFPGLIQRGDCLAVIAFTVSTRPGAA